jgi:hypothetical protein
MCLPQLANFWAFYERQPSTMVSWAHSKKMLVELANKIPASFCL